MMRKKLNELFEAAKTKGMFISAFKLIKTKNINDYANTEKYIWYLDIRFLFQFRIT